MSSLPAPSSFIDHIDLTEEEVYQGLTELDPTKAKECDQLPLEISMKFMSSF